LRRGRPPKPIRKISQAAHLLSRCVKGISAQANAGAVMRVGDQKESNRQRIVAGGNQVAQGGEATCTLRHLFAGCRGKMLGMQPDARKGLVVRRLRLRDLVLVVRKHQIDAAAMEVECRTQVSLVHRRACDVTAGTSPSKRRIPGGADALVLRLGLLPER